MAGIWRIVGMHRFAAQAAEPQALERRRCRHAPLPVAVKKRPPLEPLSHQRTARIDHFLLQQIV